MLVFPRSSSSIAGRTDGGAEGRLNPSYKLDAVKNAHLRVLDKFDCRHYSLKNMIPALTYEIFNRNVPEKLLWSESDVSTTKND